MITEADPAIELQHRPTSSHSSGTHPPKPVQPQPRPKPSHKDGSSQSHKDDSVVFIETEACICSFADSLGPGDSEPVKYRLYKRRFSGLVGLVILSLASGMPWPWFGPISTETSTQFNISINRVDWLGNIVSCVYLPVTLAVPALVARFDIRFVSILGALTMIISGWIRYAGTASSLASNADAAYALLILGQLCSAIVQPIFQVLGPIYSEKWFDLRGRTTATMLVAIANPVGGALGQLISPLVGTVSQSILILAIISTAAAPAALLIESRPPTPPTYAGSQNAQSMTSLLRALFGLQCTPEAYMTPRERADFVIALLLFGVLVGAANTFSLLSAQYLEPAGYSSDTAGLMGAVLLLSGILASAATAPLFDRVFTHPHTLARTLRVLVPLVCGCWLGLVFAVVPDNTGGLFALMALIGTGSITLLPVGLELGAELTRNADGSAALLWGSGNLFAIIFILSEGALRAGADASPPYNMRKGLVLQACFVMVFGALVFGLRARQVRRERDALEKARGLQGV